MNKHNGRSPLVISDDDEVDSPENLSDDNTPSNTDIFPSSASGSFLRAPRICPQFVDINQEWEYRKIIGDEVVGGVPCYEVEWCSSLIPKASVRSKEVVAEYEARKARARARCGAKGKQTARMYLKHSSRTGQDANATAGQPQKRPRGRARKVPSATVG